MIINDAGIGNNAVDVIQDFLNVITVIGYSIKDDKKRSEYFAWASQTEVSLRENILGDGTILDESKIDRSGHRECILKQAEEIVKKKRQ